MDLTARYHGNFRVEQIDQAPQDAALRLSAQSEQDEVVAREDRVDQLRNDGVVVADDAGKQRVAGLQLADQVVADLLLDRTHLRSTLPPKFTQGSNDVRHEAIVLRVLGAKVLGARCGIHSSEHRARWSLRIAAAPRSRRKTPSRRSIAGSRRGPTASSSTSGCRATASSSCTM